MKRWWLAAFFLAGWSILVSIPSVRAAPPNEPTPPQSAAILCLPLDSALLPDDCLATGPVAYLDKMASVGITFPQRPLPAYPADPALAVVPYSYAQLKESATDVYASVEDAQNKSNAVDVIAAGRLKYISYLNTADVGGSSKPDFFQLRDGNWVGGVATRIGGTPRFQGLVFQSTPTHAFGWIRPFRENAQTKRTPGLEQNDYTGRYLQQYEIVQIFDVQQVGNTEWLLVGPDEWLDTFNVARVIPNPQPPAGVPGKRWIEVNLAEQTMAVYEDAQLVFATVIASGMDPFWTRPGTFQIYKRLESTLMNGSFEADRSDYYYLQDVPWTMYYDKARALHGAYWRTAFGFPQSHGCINLSPGDAHWLFDWAVEGDWVYVWDPSGKTPTDPEYYSDGGA